MAVKKKGQWGGIWKSVKMIDKDTNGYLTIDELEEIFREWFPVELDGKSLVHFLRKYSSV
jgi:Ca2+-binding EF-hand superfamily protein